MTKADNFLEISSPRKFSNFSDNEATEFDTPNPYATPSRSAIEEKIASMNEKFRILSIDDNNKQEREFQTQNEIAPIKFNINSANEYNVQITPRFEPIDTFGNKDFNPSPEEIELYRKDFDELNNFMKNPVKQNWDEDFNSLFDLPEAPSATHLSSYNRIEEAGVTIADIEQGIINSRIKEAEKKLLEAERNRFNDLIAEDISLSTREELAKSRVLKLRDESNTRVKSNRLQLFDETMKKEASLLKRFVIKREELEDMIEAEGGFYREELGVDLTNKNSLNRSFQVYTNKFPQPVEFRIRSLKSPRDRIPEGDYAIILTQFDSLGGRPLYWTKLGGIGIGKGHPGITKSSYHSGNYYCKQLKFESSCFALCPPLVHIRPSFTYVLELVQLKSKINPTNNIIGWTALPMSYERLTMTEGKFKLPLLRGSHDTSMVTHFSMFEDLISNDLDNWICNIYFDLRAMSLYELENKDILLKSARFDLNYLNKSINSHDINDKINIQSSNTNHMNPLSVFSMGSDIKNIILNNKIFSKNYNEDINDIIEADNDAFDSDSVRKNFSTDSSIEDLSSSLDQKKKKFNYSSSNEFDIYIKSSIGDIDKKIFQRKNSKPIPSSELISPSVTYNKLNSYVVDKKSGFLREVRDKKKNIDELVNNQASRKNSFVDDDKKNRGTSLFGKFSNFIKGSSKSKPMLKVLNHHDSTLSEKARLLDAYEKDREINKEIPVDNIDNTQFFSPEIYVRGYNYKEKFFLHNELYGKLAGNEVANDLESQLWSTVGHEGKIIRKFVSEGSRFDSESVVDSNLKESSDIQNVNEISNYNDDMIHLVSNNKTQHVWQELKYDSEYAQYSMNIIPSTLKKRILTTGTVLLIKLKYIFAELNGSFFPYLQNSVEFYTTIFLYILIFFLRLYIHFYGQYLFLLFFGPVLDYEFNPLYVKFKYVSTSLTFPEEILLVLSGTFSVTIIFIVFILFELLIFKYSGIFSKSMSFFFALFGLVIIFDPILVLIIDLIFHNYGCSSMESCTEYYSSKCDCYYGDFVKLWERTSLQDRNGLSGCFLTILLYIFLFFINTIIFYIYIINIYNNGIIKDLYNRVNNPEDNFFIPHDNELSIIELNNIIDMCKYYHNKNNKNKYVVKVYDDSDYISMVLKKQNTFLYYNNFRDDYIIKIIQIQEVYENENISTIYRQFLLTSKGKLLEFFDNISLDSISNENDENENPTPWKNFIIKTKNNELDDE